MFLALYFEFLVDCIWHSTVEYYCSDNGCCIHTDATTFVVLLGDTDSTSLLSYSQRHYDI